MIYRNINLPINNSFFLFGPRQTGKTTLLKEFLSNQQVIAYDFLKTDVLLRLLNKPSLLREDVQARSKAITHVFIDEVQNVPLLLNEVHEILESPEPPIFILTGSSARKLKRSHANMLGGRALTFNLYPLTAQELGQDFFLKRVLQFGALPSVILCDEEELMAERLRAYVSTYLKEEIQAEAQVRQLDVFVRFLTVAAMTDGQLVNYSKIGSETGTSYQSVKSYFQILEDTLLGFFLYPFLRSKRKRLSQQPKFYFFDLGVTRALTRKLTLPLEEGTSEFGFAFEHFVILEIMRHAEYRRADWAFSCYRTESDVEVDLIIEKPSGETVALEIKSTTSVESRHLRGLKSFLEIVPQAKPCCVSLDPHKRIVNGVTVLPWQEMIEWLFDKLF